MYVHWLFAASKTITMQKTEEKPSIDLKMFEPVKLQNPS